jgi:hypothetical protein
LVLFYQEKSTAKTLNSYFVPIVSISRKDRRDYRKARKDASLLGVVRDCGVRVKGEPTMAACPIVGEGKGEGKGEGEEGKEPAMAACPIVKKTRKSRTGRHFINRMLQLTEREQGPPQAPPKEGM